MTGGIHKYWGFISYSHRDRQWGEWLHKAIESYRVPARLAGTSGRHGVVPKKLFPIFRDRTELSAAGGLDVALQNALDQSRCLIIICSPASAASRWVNEEILYFKRRGGEDRILCLIVDGEPGASAGNQPERECFPPALRFKLGPDGALSDTPAEPLAADLREQADGRDGARLKILAGLLGVGFDDLKRRDLQTRNRRLAVLAGISTAVSAAMVVLAVKAFVAQKAAERSRQQGEDLISFMLGDLREKLEPLGKLEILDAVGDKAMGYFSKLDSNNLSEAALTARAKALRQIGDVRMQQGRAAEAAEPLTAALALNQQLVDRHPNNPDLVFELGQSEFYVGYAAWRAGHMSDALSQWNAYLEASQKLVDMDSKNSKWQLELVYSLDNLGSLSSAQNNGQAALEHFQRAAEVARAITPQTDTIRSTLANNLSWQGTTLQYMGRLTDALGALTEQANIFRSLCAENKGDAKLKFKLASSLLALTDAQNSAGNPQKALEIITEGKKIIGQLIFNDKTNLDYAYVANSFDYFAALSMASQDRWTEAAQLNESLERSLTTLYKANRESSDLNGLLQRNYQLSFDISLKNNQLEKAGSVLQNELFEANCNADNITTDKLFSCANGYLQKLEYSTFIRPNDSMAEKSRSAISAILTRLSNATSKINIRSIVIKVALIDSKNEVAIRELSALHSNGYRPPQLKFFLRRQCAREKSYVGSEVCAD
jgi:eukaryotic-like serine/threonine-protein kinase